MKRKQLSDESRTRECICGSTAPCTCFCSELIETVPCRCSAPPEPNHICPIFLHTRERAARIATLSDMEEAVREAFRAMRALCDTVRVSFTLLGAERLLCDAIRSAHALYVASVKECLSGVIPVAPLVGTVIGYTSDTLWFKRFDISMPPDHYDIRLHMICSNTRLRLVRECAEIMTGKRLQRLMLHGIGQAYTLSEDELEFLCDAVPESSRIWRHLRTDSDFSAECVRTAAP